MTSLPRVEIDGAPASAGQLRAMAMDGYGHFTAMQVRDCQVRGLDLHLLRLAAGNRELFGTSLDREQVRGYIRHALGADVRDASVRVIIQRPGEIGRPCVMVTVRSPAPPPVAVLSVQSVPYQRAVAHIKHAADFGQVYYGRLAKRNGFDEALLTGPDGLIAEGSITNIGFFDGRAVIWPAAAMLSGITMQLIQARLAVPQLHKPVRLADLDSFATVFVTNSHGIAAVGRVDDRKLPSDAAFLGTLRECYESVPWDVI